MKLSQKQLYLFGPLTVLIEWSGLLVGIKFAKNFDTNSAISTLSTAPQPLPLIFGLTLTLAGLSYSIFSFALKEHSRHVTIVAFVSGALLTLTGWIRYSGNGGIADLAHNLSIYLAVAGYCLMVLLLSNHINHRIRFATKVTLVLLILAGSFALYSLFVSHKYESVAELLVVFCMQLWTLVIVSLSLK